MAVLVMFERTTVHVFNILSKRSLSIIRYLLYRVYMGVTSITPITHLRTIILYTYNFHVHLPPKPYVFC